MPQAGRVTDSGGGERVRVGELDLLPPPSPPTVLISHPRTSQLTVLPIYSKDLEVTSSFDEIFMLAKL